MFLAYLIAVVALVICVIFSLVLGAALVYVYTKLKALGKSAKHTPNAFIVGCRCLHSRFSTSVSLRAMLDVTYRYSCM